MNEGSGESGAGAPAQIHRVSGNVPPFSKKMRRFTLPLGGSDASRPGRGAEVECGVRIATPLARDSALPSLRSTLPEGRVKKGRREDSVFLATTVFSQIRPPLAALDPPRGRVKFGRIWLNLVSA
jgi:hypothetical protein